jgi:hypothetical protein
MWPFSKKEKREPEPLAANAKTGPPVFITYRADPVHNGDHDTQWWNVGRDPEHAWPHHQLYQFLSPRDWLSVAGWPFSSVGHTQAGSMVYMPNGTFIPQVGRSNITAPPQTSLGAQNAVQAPVTIDANHLKLYR